MEKYYTPNEVAKLVNLSGERVRQYAKNKALPKFAGAYVFTEADISDLISRKGQRGNKSSAPRGKQAKKNP